MESKVCQFNKFGYCKFTQYCRNRHIESLCDIAYCQKSLCEKRHPQLCRYFSIYQKCKFGDFCKFKHINKCREDFKSKIDALEKNICINKETIENLCEKVTELEYIIKEIRENRSKSTKEDIIEVLEDEIVVYSEVENVNNSTAGSETFNDSTVDIPQLDGSSMSVLYQHKVETRNIPQLNGYVMIPCGYCGMSFGAESLRQRHHKKCKKKKQMMKLPTE